MMFLYSLKLFGSNWGKALKLFLYYVVIWGVCLALLVPVILEFKGIVATSFSGAEVSKSLTGVFQGGTGLGLRTLVFAICDAFVTAFASNAGLVIYGLIVLFVILPFLMNVGKYTFCEMLYSYMTSKSKTGFFTALVRGARKSLAFAICKTLYNILLFAITLGVVYSLALIENEFFTTCFFPAVLFLWLVLIFTLNQLTVLGWMPASIVFDCNAFSAHHKGMKAVGRHFWATFGTTTLYFFLFWLLVMIFGIYTMAVLVPLLTILLCVYNMVMFFSSQGMRFYYNSTNILTPKKLEEVDNINKTAFIL